MSLVFKLWKSVFSEKWGWSSTTCIWYCHYFFGMCPCRIEKLPLHRRREFGELSMRKGTCMKSKWLHWNRQSTISILSGNGKYHLKVFARFFSYFLSTLSRWSANQMWNEKNWLFEFTFSLIRLVVWFLFVLAFILVFHSCFRVTEMSTMRNLVAT